MMTNKKEDIMVSMRDKVAETIAEFFLGEPKAIHLAASDKILSLFPSLDDIVVEEECPNIGKDAHNHPANPCPTCHGTGKISRQADSHDYERLRVKE